MPNYKDNASAVFKAMQSDGVTGIGKDENEFYELMKKPENRSSVYSYLTSNEYTGIGNSLDEFTNMVYDPNTNRAVETPKQKSAWESTVERFTPSVKGAPMMLTPTGQQEYKKAQEQKQIQKVFDRKSEADKAIDKVNEKVTSPYAPIPSVTEQAKRSLPDAQEEQKQIDELFDKTIEEAVARGQKAYDETNRGLINESNRYGVSPSGSYSSNFNLMALKAQNEEVTPSKIIGAIQEQIMNNGSQNGSDGNNESVDPIQQAVGEKASKLQAQRIYDYVRQKLIEKNVPQSKWEAFFRTMLSNNLALNLYKYAVMTPEQLQYDAMSMSEDYNKKNKLGTVSNITANVLGVVTDPTTAISAGAGSTAANMTTKFMLNSASKWGVNQATRFMMSRGANWMLPKVVGGMVNFATFEGLGSVSGQLGSGQDVNWGDVAFSTAKGAGMGAIMPVFSDIFTSGIEKTLGRYSTSYGGKLLKYGGDLTARTAIFAGGNVVQQWATNPNFDWRTADYGEIVGDALATNLGFDLFHFTESLIKTKGQNVVQMFSKNRPTDLAFTKDDVRTAKACGLDVKDGDINSLINALGKIAEEDAKNGQKYNTDATAKDLNKYLNESGLGQILQHENMTQSLSAKIKSAVTGKAEIPMITNAEVSYDENDKMFHARTFNSVGVVEDRAFSSRKDANNFFNSKVDECRVGRVKEMECSLTAQNIAKTTSEVGELVARKFKLTNEEFKKILNKKGELTPEEKSVMDAYNAMLNTEEAPTRFVEDARKATAEEYKISLDMMDKIAESDYKSLSAKEKNIYRFYEEKLRLTKEENFKSETSTENGNPTEGESKSQLTDYTDPSTGKHDTFIYDSTGNGMSMNDAWDEGGKLNPTEVKERLSKSASQIDPAVKASIDKAFDDNTVMDLLRQMDGNMDDNVIAYIKAKMNQKGLYSVAVSESGNAASISVINKYGKQSGTVRKGIIGGKEVVITGNPTDEFCYYKNPETGNIDRCDWRMVSEMTEANVEDLISEAAEAAKAETKAKIDHQFAHEPETHQDYKAGDDFYALNDKGESKHYQVVGVDENGNVTYGELNDKGEPTNMKVATKEQLKSMEDESYLVRNGLVEKNAETTPTETVATETEAPQTETAPVESVAPVEEAKPQSALDRIPKDKNGKEIWTQAENPSDVIDGLTKKLNGNSQRAEELIDNMIASAKSNLEKAEKEEVKPSDDLNKMLDDEQKKNDNIETAKKNLEYWENVKKEIENRKVEEERKQNEQNENDVLNNAIEQANNETPTEEVTTEETPVEEPQQKTVEEIDSEIKELDKQLRSLLNIKDDRDIDSQTINSRTPKVGNKREKANNLLEQINALKEERKSVAPEEVVEEAPQTVTSEEAASIADAVNTPTDAELASEEYNARMQANLNAIEKKKQETIQKAVGVAITEGKRLGTNINVLNTPEELKAVLGEGYDDMSPENVNAFTLPNGKVYIYAPSMKSEKFAVRQVWHEVIGHNGIKAILNAKDRTQFYSDIFKFMDEKAKDRFGRYVYGSMDKDSRDALGFDSYDELAKNAEAKQKFINDNFETIADEYVARNYAEGGEFEKGVWQTIKDMFTHYAHSLGFGAFSDADIRYMLGRADKNIVVKNGYAKVNARTVKEDIVGAFKKMMDGDNVKVAFGISAPVKDTKIGMKPLTAQQIENLRQMTGQSESDIVNTYGVNKNVKFSKEEDDEKKPRLQGGLYSNAEKAVLDIKQNKATADQWLNMLKNNGGLKEGEDKWIGLSDWLRNRRGMTTKEEVLDYIRKNAIKVYEVNYGSGQTSKFKPIWYEDDFWSEELAEEGKIDKGDVVLLTDNDDHMAAYVVKKKNGKFDVIKYDDYLQTFDTEEEAKSFVESFYGNATDDEFANKSENEIPINSTRLNYTTKGLDNKKEVVLSVPSVEPFQKDDEIHFGTDTNGKAIAWCRFGETTDADGNRVLVIDEIQSNRHQEGRQKGYIDLSYINKRIKEIEDRRKEIDEILDKARSEGVEIAGNKDIQPLLKERKSISIEEGKLLADRRSDAIPSAPFESNWMEVVAKRMLRYASENGYDKVAWTSGEQQAERYNIGNVISKISVFPDAEFGGRQVMLREKNGDIIDCDLDKDGIIENGQFKGNHISDVVGKELGNKIVNAESDEVYEGTDLRIGGEGMKTFYNKMLPNFMRKFGKKFGSSVGAVTLPNVEESGKEMWSVNVTPQMKDTAMKEGFPLFSRNEGYSVDDEENSSLRFSVVEDKDRIDWFEKSPKIVTYKTIAVGDDGKMHAPMADRVKSSVADQVAYKKDGSPKARLEKETVKTGNYEYFKILAAEENPNLIKRLKHDKKTGVTYGEIEIVREDGESLVVAYDPYDHSSDSMINDQFKSAWERDNLIVIEQEISQQDLDEKYRADNAFLTTGKHDWKKGCVGNKLPDTDARHVYLARWSRPLAQVSWDKVAQEWIDKCTKYDIEVPFNVVPKAIRETLYENGVKIVEPETGMGENCFKAYEEWKNSHNPNDPNGGGNKATTNEGARFSLSNKIFGIDIPYRNHRETKMTISDILREVMLKKYDEAGTDVIFYNNFAYVIDHSNDKELYENLKDGTDGFGIRYKCNLTGLPKDYYELFDRLVIDGESQDDNIINEVFAEVQRIKRANNSIGGNSSQRRTTNRDVSKTDSSISQETNISTSLDGSRESATEVSQRGRGIDSEFTEYELKPASENVSKAININDSSQTFTQDILDEKKSIETRNGRIMKDGSVRGSLDSLVGQRVALISTGTKDGAKVVGYATIADRKVYDSPESFKADENLHQVAEGSEFDISKSPSGIKVGYVLSDVKSEENPYKPKQKGNVIRNSYTANDGTLRFSVDEGKTSLFKEEKFIPRTEEFELKDYNGFKMFVGKVNKLFKGIPTNIADQLKYASITIRESNGKDIMYSRDLGSVDVYYPKDKINYKDGKPYVSLSEIRDGVLDKVKEMDNDLQNGRRIMFSRTEDDGIERDASGRPIWTAENSHTYVLTPEGRQKYQAWENAVKEWDKAHPLDMKNRKAAAKTVAKVVKEALEEGGLSEVEIAELNKFMNTMSNTNTTNIVAMTSRAFKIAAGAISKANNKTIDRLLSLKLTDRNGKNMSIAGSVDYNAQEIFKMLKANWETFDSESVQKRIDKLNEKMDKHAEAVANGEKPEEAWTQDDSNELTALETLLKNKTVREVANEIKEIIDEQRELEKQRKENYAKYKNAEISPDEYKAERDRIKVKEDALDVEMNERLNAKMDAEQAVINTLTELAEGGREDKQSWIEREQNRKRDLISNMTLNLWSDKKVDPQEMSDYTKEGGKSEFMKTVKPAFTVMASSFEYLAKNLNEYGAGKDSWFYNYFIRGKEGVLQASSDYYDSMRKHQETLDAKCKEIFGKDYNSVLKEMSKEFEHSGVHVDLAYESNRIRGGQGGKTELSLSKGEATYLYMLWKMNDGNAQLLRDGFTLDSMQEIEDFIGEKNVKFAEWMQNEYLPEMRKKYNDKYIELFNTSLAHVDNYVPLKRVSEMAQQSSDLNDETNYKDVLTASTGAIINRTRSKNPINLGTNAYQLIFDHLNEMEKWHAYARVRKDLDIILGSTHLRNKMNRNSAGMHTRLKYAAATATLVPNNRELNTLDEALAKMSKMLAGAPIAFRNTTALKQYASLVNGFRYATDALFIPEMIARSVEDITLNTPAWFKNVAKMGFGTQEALKRAANGDSYWKTGFSPNLSWCLQNIPDFYERVLKGTAGNANLEFDTWDNAVGAFADEYMKKGMISNQLIDAITCSIIIRSVYDGKMRVYKKQGMPFEEADRQAKMDAVVAYNSSQQSSHPAFLAPAQKSKKAMDRAYSLFNTANLGFARDFITSMSDCLRLMKPESKSFYTHKLMNENPDMTREEAEKIANKEIRKAYGWAMSGILFSGFVGALSWDFHSKGLLGALQNEEEDKDKRRNNLIKQFISCPARGIPPVDVGVALISAYLDGDKASGIASKLLKQNLLSSQLEKIFRETGTAYEDFGFSPELAYSVINNCATIPILGVDLNTHVNMIQGVSAMVRDGIVSPYFGTDSANTKDKLMLDIMQILNTPKSNRTEVMKTLLKDKVVNDEISYEDYMRLVEIAAGYKVDNDPIRSWMPNARLLKEAKKNEFKKEFESYFLSLDDKKEMKENDEKRKEMSEVGKEESNANKFEDFALHTSRTREFMKHKKEYDEYKTLSSVNSAWKRLLQNNPDEADKFEKEHKEELERYRDNIGKFKSISSQLKLFGMEGEDKNEIFDEIIKALSEE